MIVYVSGAISPSCGEKDLDKNIKVGMDVASEVWAKGHFVHSPHGNTYHLERYDSLKNISNKDWVEKDFQIIAVCDAMVMCPKWETSKGCISEKEYAESLGIPVYIYPEIPELHPTEVRNPNQAQAFRETIGQMYRLHLRKNADYSPANILGTGEIGLVTRMWDKMARLLNLTGFNIFISGSDFSVPKQPKNESIEDTIMDLAVYSIISLIFRRGKWGN